MEQISALFSSLLGFLGASVISALMLFGVSETTLYTKPVPTNNVAGVINATETDVSGTYVDFSKLISTTTPEAKEFLTESLALTAPVALPLTQAVLFDDTYSLNERIVGLLSHVRWLIKEEGKVVSVTSHNDTIRKVTFDKQIDRTTDNVLDSVNDILDDLEGDLSTLDSRLVNVEADLASISLAAASTSVMAANLTMNGHWLSGDGADEGVFVTGAGNVGVGTSTPSSRLVVGGDIFATGAFRDSSNGAGTSGYVLQTTGSGTQWVATSSLGFTGGGASFSTSAELAALLSDEVGTGGGFVRASSTMLTSPNIFGGTLNGTFSGGTFTSGTWQGNAISSTYLDSAIILSSEIDSSSEISTLVTDETGTGALVFANSPTLTGTLAGASATLSGTLGVSGTSTLATTTASTLTVAGALRDSSTSAGTAGMVLQTTGTGTQWVATSSLGFPGGSGVTNFLALTDTPSSYTANRIMYTNSAATALIDSADFTYNGIDFGLGGSNGIAFGGTRYITASTTNDSVTFGENAGASFNTDTTFNIALGYGAGQYASTTDVDYSNYIGYLAGQNSTGTRNNLIGAEAGLGNSGLSNNIIGYSAGYSNSGSQNNFFGTVAGYGNSGSNNNGFGGFAGYSNTGQYNNMIGYQSGRNNTGDYNNFIGRYAGYSNTGTNNDMIGSLAGRWLQSTSSVVIGSEAFYGGIAFQAINNVALGYRAGYAAQTGSDNNILIGYQAADNLTTGNNNIIIGYDIDSISATADNVLNIGNLIFGTNLDGTGTTLSSGKIGIGTSTPIAQLSVVGDIYATGAFHDSNNATGPVGSVLQTTGTGTQWVATSSLGFPGGSGVTNFLALTDTPSSYTANRIMYTNSAATALIDSADFTYNGIDFGLGGSNGIAFGGTRYITASTTNDSVTFGENAGVSFTDQTTNNVAIGYQAGRYASTTGADDSNLIGYQAGYNNSGGRSNLIGYQAGYNNTALSVVAIGYQALGTTTGANTDGSTIAIGFQALFNNTSGSANVAVGGSALQNNTTGSSNTAFGDIALQFNTTGGSNSAFGFSALQDNTTGNSNSAFGQGSLQNNTTGLGNSSFGAASLDANTTGYSNAAFGASSLGANIDGYSNTAFGNSALINLSAGNTNTAIGQSAGSTQTAGSNNIMIGYNAAVASTTGSNQLSIANVIYGGVLGTTPVIGIGTSSPSARFAVLGHSGSTLDNFRVASSSGATLFNVTSAGNVGIGTTSPSSLLTIAGDIFATGAFKDSTNAAGTAGMVLQTTGSGTQWVATSTLGLGGGSSLFTDGGATAYLTATGDNLAIGTTTATSKLTVDGAISALDGINFGGQRSVFIDSSSNMSFGEYALFYAENNVNVYSNIGVGDNAGNNLQSGFSNVIMGFSAGANVATGSRSVILGDHAAGGNAGVGDIGSMVIIGDGAGYDLESGANWGTFVGYRAGENVTTGSGNTLFGYQAGNNITTGYNNVIIGYDIDAVSASAFETLNIGNLIFGTDIDGTGTTISNGNIGIGTTTPGSKLTVAGTIEATNLLGGATNLTTDANGNIIRDPSDARLKENVVTLENALDKVLALRGVRYEWIDKERFGDQFEVGFIAQEVDEVVPEVVTKGGEYWSLNSKNLIAVVVEAMKEMWATVSGHEERLGELEAENAELKARLEAVENELDVDESPSPVLVPTPEPVTPPVEEGTDIAEGVFDELVVEEVVEEVAEVTEEVVETQSEPETEPTPEPETVPSAEETGA